MAATHVYVAGREESARSVTDTLHDFLEVWMDVNNRGCGKSSIHLVFVCVF